MALGTSWTNIASGSFTKNGATLTYYIDAKLSSQSVANNTSTIATRARTVFSGYTMGGSNYSFSCTGCTTVSGSGVYYYSTETVLSGSTTVTHNADGTKTFSMSGACTNGYLGMNISLSGSVALPTIPRASKPTVSTDPLTIGSTQTITTNRASSSFTHTIKIEVGSYSTTITGVGTSTTWTPSASDLMPVMDTWQKTVTITCTTYNGSTQIGSAQTKTFTLQVDTSTYKPVIGTITQSDQNATTSALETSGTYIKGYSDFKTAVALSVSNTDYGDTLASAKVVCGGVSQTYGLSGTSANITFTRNSLAESSLTISVTDNRGYTVTQTVTLTLIDYSPITTTSVSYKRVNANNTESETGEYIRYTIECSVFYGSFGQANNSITVKSRRKLASASTYDSQVTEQTITTSGTGTYRTYTVTGVSTQQYSPSSQYDVIYTLSDALTSRTFSAIRIHEGIPVFAWGSDHFDVYGTLHIHDRSTPSNYISVDHNGAGLSGILLTQRYTSASTSCTASDAGSVSISVTVPTGYTFIGVIGAWSNGNVVPCYCNNSSIYNGAVTVWWRNPTSSAITCTFTVNVLFIRT